MGEFLSKFIEKHGFAQPKLTKLTELCEKLGIVSFVSANGQRKLRDYGAENASIYYYEELSGFGDVVGSDFAPFPAWCSVCGSEMRLSESLSLIKLECPIVCPFTYYQVRVATDSNVNRLLKLLTPDEIDAAIDSVEERVAILAAEGIEGDDATRIVQQSILPPLLEMLELR